MARKVKPRCPACSARMKAKDRYCGECGRRNPLFPAKPARAVKSAAAPATVHDIRTAQLWRQVHSEPDPSRREVFIDMIAKGGRPA